MFQITKNLKNKSDKNSITKGKTFFFFCGGGVCVFFSNQREEKLEDGPEVTKAEIIQLIPNF